VLGILQSKCISQTSPEWKYERFDFELFAQIHDYFKIRLASSRICRSLKFMNQVPCHIFHSLNNDLTSGDSGPRFRDIHHHHHHSVRIQLFIQKLIKTGHREVFTKRKVVLIRLCKIWTRLAGFVASVSQVITLSTRDS